MKTLSICYALLVALFFTTINSSCSKDKEETTNCTEFTVLEGKMTIDGKQQRLSIAQFIAQNNFYAFQLASISDDCNEQKLVSFSITTTSGNLGGNYPFDSDPFSENTANGDIVVQKISPISQSSVSIKSGTVKVTELGTKKYTIDLNVVDVLGGKTSLSLTHQF